MSGEPPAPPERQPVILVNGVQAGFEIFFGLLIGSIVLGVAVFLLLVVLGVGVTFTDSGIKLR